MHMNIIYIYIYINIKQFKLTNSYMINVSLCAKFIVKYIYIYIYIYIYFLYIIVYLFK